MWRDIESAPKDGKVFLAAIPVHNSLLQTNYYDYALMYYDEGRFHFCDEADTGWDADDYTDWESITPPEFPKHVKEKI